MPPQYIDEDSLKSIRQNLWTIANRKSITLEDIQDRTGFSYSQVHRIIRGKNNTSISHLVAVCRALECQPNEVFNFEIKIPKYPKLRRELNKK